MKEIVNVEQRFREGAILEIQILCVNLSETFHVYLIYTEAFVTLVESLLVADWNSQFMHVARCSS